MVPGSAGGAGRHPSRVTSSPRSTARRGLGSRPARRPGRPPPRRPRDRRAGPTRPARSTPPDVTPGLRPGRLTRPLPHTRGHRRDHRSASTRSRPSPAPSPSPGADHAALLADALFQVKKVIVGQDRLVERVMLCLLADGHCLIEGFPGLAKTLTVSTMAQAVGGDFARLQFTPDLVPADLVGHPDLAAVARGLRRSSGARCSRTSCWRTRSTAPPRRSSPRCSRRWPSGT